MTPPVPEQRGALSACSANFSAQFTARRGTKCGARVQGKAVEFGGCARRLEPAYLPRLQPSTSNRLTVRSVAFADTFVGSLSVFAAAVLLRPCREEINAAPRSRDAEIVAGYERLSRRLASGGYTNGARAVRWQRSGHECASHRIGIHATSPIFRQNPLSSSALSGSHCARRNSPARLGLLDNPWTIQIAGIPSLLAGGSSDGAPMVGLPLPRRYFYWAQWLCFLCFFCRATSTR
jgi:hypothetical protein